MVIDFRVQDVATPLGRIVLGGQLLDHVGTPLGRPDWHSRGAYCMACVRRGRGLYFDATGRSLTVETGDIIVVPPELEHRYGPEGDETWDECFLVFEGPLFDLSRATGLFREPIIRLGTETEGWCDGVLTSIDSLHAEPNLRRFLEVVATMFKPISPQVIQAKPDDPEWLPRTRARLDRLEEGIELDTLAREIGISSRTLQRQFQHSMGTSPQKYRDERRLRMALELLTNVPGIKMRTVAERIGFADEFYFSRWFRRKVGLAPHRWQGANQRLP